MLTKQKFPQSFATVTLHTYFQTIFKQSHYSPTDSFEFKVIVVLNIKFPFPEVKIVCFSVFRALNKIQYKNQLLSEFCQAMLV